ncbi:unnamed protein product [Didymodactylos carnosus]|uniref:RING-type domain-containing protein n=1 Tax=Didymodactylos carnosus TaxID=1234261 RepID=A0A814Q440_9BILA|nr:unnamed protein product [Didymodactylos carnosus]CAF3878544.1 unnamed protein product [Didymodactylos carnosus]
MPGQDIHNKKDINEIYLCPVCELILKNPCQLPCGDRLCQECIPALIREDAIFKCPVCAESVHTSNLMVDKGFGRDLDQLEVICIEKRNNCEWAGKLKYYQDHLNNDHLNYSCNLCQEKFATPIALNEHKECVH